MSTIIYLICPCNCFFVPYAQRHFYVQVMYVLGINFGLKHDKQRVQDKKQLD